VAQPANVLAPLLTSLAIALGGGVIAWHGSQAAAGFHARLNEAAPPLASAPPTLGPGPATATTSPLARRVVVVVIDGLRLDASFGHPWLDRLRRRGSEAIGVAGFPTWSRPNQAAILTGVPPLASGVRSNDYAAEVGLDSLMDRAAAAGLRSAYVADVSFGMARMFHADFETTHYVPWAGGLGKAIRLVVGQGYPLVVIVPGAADEAAHRYGVDGEHYRGAIAAIDRTLGDALADLDLTRDAVIVTADHGHIVAGGHGGVERDVVQVPIVLAGAGVRPGAALGEVPLTAIAPTVAALLGVPAPGHGVSPGIVAALALEPAARAARIAADADRVAHNRGVIERARRDETARAAAIGARRLGAGAIALVLAGLALWWLRRVGGVQLDWRVLGIALPAFPLTFYMLVDVIGSSFSLSAVPDRQGALDRLIGFGLIATAVQVVASWFALHSRRVLRERLAAASGLTLVGLLVSGVPAGLLWALSDPGSQPILPLLATPKALVLAPAAWIAVSFFALASAVTIGLELVVFFARGLDPRGQRRRASDRATDPP
jgi:hypothetical protein